MQTKVTGTIMCVDSVVFDMNVAVLPTSEPAIVGLQAQHYLGDYINITCTSAWSSPAPSLSWYINGVKVTYFLANLSCKPTPFHYCIYLYICTRGHPSTIRVPLHLGLRPPSPALCVEPLRFTIQLTTASGIYKETELKK